ncbi:MAG: hypothetical protein ACOYI3_06325 [Christensenellales bacterium]|jgi:hypothetical protein
MITVRVAPFEDYGDCLFLDNGIIDVVVALSDLRLLRYGFCNKENMLHLPENDQHGGHFLALLLDNEKVPVRLENCGYERTDLGAKLTGEAKDAGFSYELEVRLNHGSSEIKLIHSVTNKKDAPVTLSLCADTHMEEGGLSVLPQSQADTGGRPNRVIAIWPNTSMADPRILWGSEYILLQQANMKPLKFGISATKGWAACFNMGHLFLMRYPVFSREPYADRGCALVANTTADYTLLSTRSPIVTLHPSEQRSHSESWTLYAGVTCPPVEEWPVYETLRGLV